MFYEVYWVNTRKQDDYIIMKIQNWLLKECKSQLVTEKLRGHFYDSQIVKNLCIYLLSSVTEIDKFVRW